MATNNNKHADNKRTNQPMSLSPVMAEVSTIHIAVPPLSEVEVTTIHTKIVEFVRTQLEAFIVAKRPVILAAVPFPFRSLAGRGYDLVAARVRDFAVLAVDETLQRLSELTVAQILGMINWQSQRINS